MKNFKTLVADAIAALLRPLAESPKEQAVRKLGIASEIISKGEAAKKAAKNTLLDLGIIAPAYTFPGELVVFDGPTLRMTANTKAASSRLDAGALDAALDAERISAAAKRRIIAASTIENKPATSFKVEAK